MFSTFLAFNGDREVIAAVATGRTGATETTPANARPSWSASPPRRPTTARLLTRLRSRAGRQAPAPAPIASPQAIITTRWTTQVPDYDREPARAC